MWRRIQAASAPSVSVHPAGGARGSGSDHDLFAPGKPRWSARASAIRACPAVLAWRRSSDQRRGSEATGCTAKSQTIVPQQPAAHHARQRHDVAEVGEGEGDHRRPDAGECTLHRLDVLAERIRIEARPQEIVRSGDHCHQVRLHGHRRVELLAADLPRRPSANGQVGVEHAPLRRSKLLRQTVRPSPIAASPIRIVESLDRAVADGNVALEWGH